MSTTIIQIKHNIFEYGMQYFLYTVVQRDLTGKKLNKNTYIRSDK
jgi:hypothetical protein